MPILTKFVKQKKIVGLINICVFGFVDKVLCINILLCINIMLCINNIFQYFHENEKYFSENMQ